MLFNKKYIIYLYMNFIFEFKIKCGLRGRYRMVI